MLINGPPEQKTTKAQPIGTRSLKEKIEAR